MQWVVNVVGYIQSKPPIVPTIFEQIENWHCTMGKPVDKRRLQNSFNVVYRPQNSGVAKTSTLLLDTC